MHASPISAPPPALDAAAKRETPLRVCIHAVGASSAAQLDALRARLPARARIALFGECAATATWEVTWTGGGTSGTLTVTRSSSTTVRIGELQVLVTG